MPPPIAPATARSSDAPDLARPLALTNIAATATVAALGSESTKVTAEDAGAAIFTPPAAVLKDVGPSAAEPGPSAQPGSPSTSDDVAPAPVADGEVPAEEPGPIGSGVLEAFLPLDRAVVDLALERVLGQLDELGAPFTDPSCRLPLVVPVAAALATAEAARRWRGRATLRGPSVARGSRFSSLRGLS